MNGIIGLNKEYLDVLDKRDWFVIGYSCYHDGNISVDLQWFSPAGEDINFTVSVKNFEREMYDIYQDFDVDEHIEMWIVARKNGVSGVPSTRELVEDAEAIEHELQELAEDLAAARKERKEEP